MWHSNTEPLKATAPLLIFLLSVNLEISLRLLRSFWGKKVTPGPTHILEAKQPPAWKLLQIHNKLTHDSRH